MGFYFLVNIFFPNLDAYLIYFYFCKVTFPNLLCLFCFFLTLKEYVEKI